MSVKLINIDDRLIHGQVATTWVKDFGIESIIVVSDVVANDPMQKSIVGLAVPNIKVNVFGVDKFLEVMKKTEIKKVTMVLFASPIDALTCFNNGFKIEYLNVSGMRFNEHRKRLHRNMSVTQEEKDAFDAFLHAGVEVWMQTTTRDTKEKVSEILKDF